MKQGKSATLDKKGVAFAALRHGDFRKYFVFAMLAMMADNIEHVISYWVLFQVFHSPVLGGFAVISHWTPFLLFSVYSGALADRLDCRRMIQTAMVMFIGVSLTWGILFLTGTIQLWHASVLLVVHGLAGVIWDPATQLLIYDMVGPEHLQSAVRLSITGRYLGILLGPAVGGALMFFLGAPAGILVNTLIYLPLIIWLMKVPYTGHLKEGSQLGRRRRLHWKDALEVLREVSAKPAIISMVTLAGLAAAFVGDAFQAQMPEFAYDLGHGREGLGYSALLAASAAGAVTGGFLLEFRGLLQPGVRTAMVCAMLWCLAIAGFAAAPSYALALILLFLAGVFSLAFNSMAQTLVQLLAPVHLRGRLIGLFSMAGSGLRTFSGLTVGVMGGLIGIHWSLGLSATAMLAVTVALYAFTLPAGKTEI